DEYRLVLTPSCDLVRGRKEKTLLVAKCCESAVLIAIMSLSLKVTKLTESAERFRKVALSTALCEVYIPLRGLVNQIPVSGANLKDLEVIAFTSIEREDLTVQGFDRVASIDSPFREQVVWGFLTTAGRPGMPERDLNLWAEECVKAAAADAPVQPGNTAPG